MSERLIERPKTEAEQQAELIDTARKLFTYGEATIGFGMNFGDDDGALDQAVRLMGLAKLMEDGKIHIHNVSVTRGGSTSLMGRSVKTLAGLPFSDALMLLQAGEFSTIEEEVGKRTIETVKLPEGRITSAIFLAHVATGENGERMTDLTKPGLVMSMSRTYVPGFFDRSDPNDYDMVPQLGKILRMEASGSWGTRAARIGALARVMAHTGLSVGTDRSDFRMSVGKFYSHSIGLDVGGVKTDNWYEINSLALPDSEEWPRTLDL